MARGSPMFAYDKAAFEAVILLDEYDFTDKLDSFLRQGIYDPHEVIEQLSALSSLIEDAFDVLTSDEQMDYLSDRYDVVFIEKVHYEMVRATKK